MHLVILNKVISGISVWENSAAVSATELCEDSENFHRLLGHYSSSSDSSFLAFCEGKVDMQGLLITF